MRKDASRFAHTTCDEDTEPKWQLPFGPVVEVEVVVVVVKVVVVVVVVVVWCGCHWQYLQVMYKILLVTEKKVQQMKAYLQPKRRRWRLWDLTGNSMIHIF